mmetsp:Transcript_7733/g.20094  ORF Transcript_7733/g.20094 Transcript_7733/m.20094 type:complete len:1081 (-) Transcript_7733:319-3561(-)
MLSVQDLPPRAQTADGFRKDERRPSKEPRRESMRDIDADDNDILHSSLYAELPPRPVTAASNWSFVGASTRASSPSPSKKAMKALLKRRNVAWGSRSQKSPSVGRRSTTPNSRRSTPSTLYSSTELAWHPFLKDASAAGLTGSLGYDEVLPLDFEPSVFDSETVERLFLARCEDIKVTPTRERLHRFYELLQQRCDDESFDLSDCGIGPVSSVELAEVLQEYPNGCHETTSSLTVATRWKKMSFASNSFQNSGAMAFARLLANPNACSSITELDLRSNDIAVEGGKALMASLGVNHTLRKLDLSGISGVNRNRIGLSGANVLGRMLGRNNTLEELSLADNGIGTEGIIAIAEGLPNNRTLTYLDVSSNNVGARGCAALCAAVLSTKLHSIGMAKNKIGDQGAHSIELLLSHSTSLATLDISDNGITADGIIPISSGLASLNASASASPLGINDKINVTSLTSLNLEKNPIGPQGAPPLGRALKQNQALKTLLVGSCDLLDKGSSEIFLCLAKNAALTELDVSSNTVGNEGGENLAHCLTFNSTLENISLANNKIGEVGGEHLAKALSKNVSMRYLNLRNNYLQNRSAGKLAEAIKTAGNVIWIDIALNDVNFINFSAIQDAVAVNAKKFAASAPTRYQSEISHLQGLRQALEERKARLMAAKHARERAQAEAESAGAELENARTSGVRSVQEMKEKIEKLKEERHKVREEIEAISYKISDVRGEFENKLELLNNRYKRESDKRVKMEKELIKKTKHVEGLQKNLNAEHEALKTQLTAIEKETQKAQFNISNKEPRLDQLRERAKALEASMNASKKDGTAAAGAAGKGGKEAVVDPIKDYAERGILSPVLFGFPVHLLPKPGETQQKGAAAGKGGVRPGASPVRGGRATPTSPISGKGGKGGGKGKNAKMTKNIALLAKDRDWNGLMSTVRSGKKYIDSDASAGGLGYTALHWVAYWGNLKVFNWLMRMGCKVTEKDEKMQTPLHVATKHPAPDVVRVCLLSGLSESEPDKSGFKPADVLDIETHALDPVRSIFKFWPDVKKAFNAKGVAGLEALSQFEGNDASEEAKAFVKVLPTDSGEA